MRVGAIYHRVATEQQGKLRRQAHYQDCASNRLRTDGRTCEAQLSTITESIDLRIQSLPVPAQCASLIIPFVLLRETEYQLALCLFHAA